MTDGTQTVPYPQEGAIIDRDLADRLVLKAGDMLTVSLSDTKSVEIPVEGVFENYVYHYAYMTAETYERIFGESCTYKTAYLLTQTTPMHWAPPLRITPGGQCLGGGLLRASWCAT